MVPLGPTRMPLGLITKTLPLAFSAPWIALGSPPVLREITHANPVFYLIDGVRYGVLGVSDSSPVLGLAICSATTLAVCALAWLMFHKGYRLKE